MAPLGLIPFRAALTNFRGGLSELLGLTFMPNIFIFLSSWTVNYSINPTIKHVNKFCGMPLFTENGTSRLLKNFST